MVILETRQMYISSCSSFWKTLFLSLTDKDYYAVLLTPVSLYSISAPGDVLLPLGMLFGCVGIQIYYPSEDDAVSSQATSWEGKVMQCKMAV